MPIKITAEREYIVGSPTIVEGSAPEGSLLAVFEDDGSTGYFYALDTSQEKQPIQDAMLIYNVANASDRTKPSTVTIGWSFDNRKSVLLINEYPHAVFDFSAKQGYCRTGFPPSTTGCEWASHSHEWCDAAIKLFA